MSNKAGFIALLLVALSCTLALVYVRRISSGAPLPGAPVPPPAEINSEDFVDTGENAPRENSALANPSIVFDQLAQQKAPAEAPKIIEVQRGLSYKSPTFPTSESNKSVNRASSSTNSQSDREAPFGNINTLMEKSLVSKMRYQDRAVLSDASTSQNKEAATPENREKALKHALEARRRLMRFQKPIEQKQAIYGSNYPFRLHLIPGYKILDDTEPLILSWKDEVVFTFEIGAWKTDIEEFANTAIENIKANYPGMEVIETELSSMDHRPWKKVTFQDTPQTEGYVEENARELMMLTHSGENGSYRIAIGGYAKDLDRHVAEINRLLQSFRFPPDNFKPPNFSEVRVYVNGVRQYF